MVAVNTANIKNLAIIFEINYFSKVKDFSNNNCNEIIFENDTGESETGLESQNGVIHKLAIIFELTISVKAIKKYIKSPIFDFKGITKKHSKNVDLLLKFNEIYTKL